MASSDRVATLMHVRRYIFFCVAVGILGLTTAVTDVQAQSLELLGVRLRREVTALVKEIEAKTRHPLYADFAPQPEFQLGAGFVDDTGRAVVVVDPALERDPKKLEAVITHELLHLRLT